MKFYKLIFLFVFIPFVVLSCSSLQEDVLVNSENDAVVFSETSAYEELFRDFDSALLNGSVVSMKEMDRFITGIEKQISNHTEPAVAGRLQALEGLVLLLQKRNKKALELYNSAKSLQSGDVYVLLLNSRLMQNAENSLTEIDEYLLFDYDNPVFLLEKGILLNKLGKYAQAVANFDNSFLIFDNQNNFFYREKYGLIRDNAWKYYSAGADSSTQNLSESLSCEGMISLTVENTNLLSDFLQDSKFSLSDLLKKLENSGYFTAVGDGSDNSFSSKELINSSEITRTLCARFLWNLYINESGNIKLRNAYSARYSRMKESFSPIEDVPLNSIDFDACVGVVEKEIMNLTDGRLFEGDTSVSAIDFLEYVKNLEKVLK